MTHIRRIHGTAAHKQTGADKTTYNVYFAHDSLIVVHGIISDNEYWFDIVTTVSVA